MPFACKDGAFVLYFTEHNRVVALALLHTANNMVVWCVPRNCANVVISQEEHIHTHLRTYIYVRTQSAIGGGCGARSSILLSCPLFLLLRLFVALYFGFLLQNLAVLQRCVVPMRFKRTVVAPSPPLLRAHTETRNALRYYGDSDVMMR